MRLARYWLDSRGMRRERGVKGYSGEGMEGEGEGRDGMICDDERGDVIGSSRTSDSQAFVAGRGMESEGGVSRTDQVMDLQSPQRW